jgi:hypothetical protein
MQAIVVSCLTVFWGAYISYVQHSNNNDTSKDAILHESHPEYQSSELLKDKDVIITGTSSSILGTADLNTSSIASSTLSMAATLN